MWYQFEPLAVLLVTEPNILRSPVGSGERSSKPA